MTAPTQDQTEDKCPNCGGSSDIEPVPGEPPGVHCSKCQRQQKTWVESERERDPEFAKMMDEETDKLAAEYATQDQTELARCRARMEDGSECGGEAYQILDEEMRGEPVQCRKCLAKVFHPVPTQARDMWQRLNAAHSPRGVSAVEVIRAWLEDELSCVGGNDQWGQGVRHLGKKLAAALAALEPSP